MEIILNQLKNFANTKNVRLNEPADSKAIAQFEKSTEINLPETLRMVYRTFDGFDNYLNHWKIFSLNEIKDYLNRLHEFEVYDDSLSKYNWNQLWIPIASDISGNLLCINLDPDTELSNDRTGIPVDFYNCGDLFNYWHDENRISSDSLNFEEWISENILSNY